MRIATTLVALGLLCAASALAKEVGRATEGNLQARLFDEQGDCPEGTQRVELFIDGVKNLDGCSIEKDGVVYTLWADGGRGAMPRKSFKPGV